ncbi:isochorismate synthase [Coraliomargarita akajimensis]|nr:isochorismate synthase [Coraliomargarita akajimensis]
MIPPSKLPQRDKASLCRFLEGCQTAARLKGRFQLASISLAVRHISPLAVLQSIYEPDELHFYVERATDDEAVAGAEAVVEARFTGPTRFAEVKAFAQELLENTIAIGDLDAAFTGPHFFTAFSFDDTVPDGSTFPAATVFVPRWQVSRSDGRYGAVANVRVDADSDIEQLVERVWGAYEKFAAFEYPDEELAEVSTMPATQVERREVSVDQFKQAVSTALDQIEAKAYEKVVLARSIELHADQDWQPLDALNRLRERFGGCFTFSFGGGQGRSFIGATPERLIKVRNGQLATDAIAGSAPRGATAREDAKFARELLESAKDLHEHACVRESILRRLESCGVSACAEAQPRLLPLPNVQHLRTRITAPASESVHLMDLVAELHPTPAVGGTPRAAAVSHIRELEKLDRGLFAGAIGWFDHRNEGEMIVGIRSALIDGAVARLYAGAGIVKGSDPRKELNETEIKLGAMLNALT